MIQILHDPRTPQDVIDLFTAAMAPKPNLTGLVVGDKVRVVKFDGPIFGDMLQRLQHNVFTIEDILPSPCSDAPTLAGVYLSEMPEHMFTNLDVEKI